MTTIATVPDSMRLTMGELFLDRAEDDHTALLFEDDRWSWRELVAEAARRSAVLQELRPEDGRPWHVGVLLENTPEYLFLLAGASLSGATIVGINPTRRGEELAKDIRGVDVDLVLVDAAYADLLEGIDHGARRVIRVDGSEWTALLDEHADAPLAATPEALDPNRTLVLLFTSGSTGAPKAVICSTGRWARVTQVSIFDFTHEDVAYNAMPLFHGNALMSAWSPCINSGAALALRRRFSASGFLPDIQKYGVTFFNYVGRSLAYVLAQPERPEEADNRLRFGFGTEASTKDRAEFLRRYGIRVFESYGSSEGACYIINTPETPDGALGVPQVGHQPEVVNADGSVCPPAEFDENGVLLNAEEAIGEIVSRNAADKFEGYYKNPEAAAEKLRDGDFWTGDLAYRDQDGFFWYAGRTADWLRVDSENFSAAPVERILARYPGVTVAAVYGVPDPRTGDLVMATLQLAPDAPTVDPAEFAAFLAAQADLGTKWAPTLLRVTRDLPVTATNKVDKPTLRRQRWNTTDTVYRRVDGVYELLDAAALEKLLGEYDEHGRRNLVS
ncbi:AMP-binding protein [Nocardioides daejeonensis]|uniref:AMP-binding protein n=1 Tax=Nocardioides daejeonensis TaxID=1046556 RepID=UPI0019505DA4|nr:AMP-binding protein [Nocardioides daejeonensis]